METTTRPSSVEREWLELMAEILSQSVADLPTERLAMQLMATFDAAACCYLDIVDGERRALGRWPVRSGIRRRAGAEEHPLAHLGLRAAKVGAIRAGCQPPAISAGVAASTGCANELLLPLRRNPASTSVRQFTLGRADRFRSSDTELAATLCRILVAIDRRIDPPGAWRAMRTTAGEANAAGGLTPRERAVLALLSDGLTAVSIGRRLAISERTVHKHLERLYAKLGVRDRLAAVLRARDERWLPSR